MRRRSVPRGLTALTLACVLHLPTLAAAASRCDDEQPTPQLPTDLALCVKLEAIVRKPSALPADQCQIELNRFLGAMCHRNRDAGWKMDKSVRDSGPFTATLVDGKWVGVCGGTHSPLVIWYSPDMIAWLRANRPIDASKEPARPAPVPDGAIMVNENRAVAFAPSHDLGFGTN